MYKEYKFGKCVSQKVDNFESTDIRSISNWRIKLADDCLICEEPLLDPIPSKVHRADVLDICLVWPENCGHYFHSKCLSSWMKKDKLCPNCRIPIDEAFTWQCVNANWHPQNIMSDHNVAYLNRFKDDDKWLNKIREEEKDHKKQSEVTSIDI